MATDEIVKIGGRADDLGQKIIELAQDTADESASAAEAFSGLELSSALTGLQRSCEHNLEGFGRWVDDMGDRLSAAAREYDKSDEWSMGKLRGIGDAS